MSVLYGKGKEKILSAQVDLLTHTIKAYLVDGADYTPDTDVDEFLDDIPGAAIVSTSPAIDNKSVTLGVFDGDPSVFPAVSGDQFEYIVIAKDTGSAATSPLLAFIDIATGMPYTPIGSQIIVTWDNGPYKIFAI